MQCGRHPHPSRERRRAGSIRNATLIAIACSITIRADAANPAEKLAHIRSLRTQGNIGAADRELTRFLNAHPEHVAARLLRGEMLADRGRWDEAAAVLGDLPGEILGYPLYHVRARVAFERGLPEAARRDLQQALRIRPGHAVDLELLARTHARCARWALAIESYQRAADAGLDTAELHLGLARAYLNRRILLGEITVMRLAGAEPGTLVDGGYVLEPAAGDDHVFRVCPPASAIYHLVAARIRGATGPTIDVLEADIWLEAGFYNRARTLYAKAETDRSDAQAAEFYERYARACLRIGHVDQGLRLLRTAVRLDPEACRSVLVDAHLEVSRHASIDGDFKLALYHLRQAVASNPDSPELHRRLGDAYARQRDHVRANEHWHKVLLLDPDHADRAALLEKIRRSANGGRNSDEP